MTDIQKIVNRWVALTNSESIQKQVHRWVQGSGGLAEKVRIWCG